MSTPAITSTEAKGLQAVRLFEATYEGRPSLYAGEEVSSNKGYPKEYAVKPLAQQADALARILSLSLSYTSEYIEKVLPTLTLPDGAEGWFAIPSIDALAKVHFPEVKNPAERYCRGVQLVFKRIGSLRKFYNYRDGQIDPRHLRIHARKAHAMNVLAEIQNGDILVVPSQFGLRHRGRSTRRAREVFAASEFGHGSLAVGSMLLTHPEREVHWNQLHPDCPGDEFSPNADGVFSRTTYFQLLPVSNPGLEFSPYDCDVANDFYGSVSGWLPQ